MNLPNILTISRIIATIGFVFFVTRSGMLYIVMASTLFFVASVTDFFDGYFARKYNQITTFGKIMDPIADKFLVLAGFFVFQQMGIIPAWMFYIILIREVAVTGSRFFAMYRGKVLAAEQAGKLKTTVQLATIALILLYLIILQMSGSGERVNFLTVLIPIAMYATIALTLYSGLQYFWNNKKILLVS